MSGIFTPEQENALGAKLDSLIDFKNIKGFGMLEIFDGFLFTKCISFVDDKYGDMIPAEYKEDCGKLAIYLVEENWAACEEPICNILDTLIDIPLLEDEQEAWIIKSIVEATFGILLTKVLKTNQPGV